MVNLGRKWIKQVKWRTWNGVTNIRLWLYTLWLWRVLHSPSSSYNYIVCTFCSFSILRAVICSWLRSSDENDSQKDFFMKLKWMNLVTKYSAVKIMITQCTKMFAILKLPQHRIINTSLCVYDCSLYVKPQVYQLFIQDIQELPNNFLIPRLTIPIFVVKAIHWYQMRHVSK